MSNNKREIQYYNRERGVVCIGTFYRLQWEHRLPVGTMFIVPPYIDHDGKMRPGCQEARDCDGKNMPIALHVKMDDQYHLTCERHGGAWAKDLCWIEQD